MARKYTRMRITHIDIYRLSLFMSGAENSALVCACALSRSLWLLSLALPLPRAHTTLHPSFTHSLAPSDPRSLVPLHSPKPGGEDGWGGGRQEEKNCRPKGPAYMYTQ